MTENVNGHVGPADIATLSLWGGGYGYGRHGYGHGGYGAEYLAANASADGTAVNAKVEANADKIDSQSAALDAAERSRQFADLKNQNSEERLANQASMNSLNNQIRDAEAAAAKCCCDTNINIKDTEARLAERIAQAAKEAAECCCDAKLEAQKNASDLRAEILAVESRSITRELDRCERRLESGESTAAILAAINAQTQMLSQVLANK